MNPQSIPVAFSIALSVGALTYTMTRPWRRLGPRVDAYTVAVRERTSDQRTQVLRLVGPPPTATGVMASVFGPILSALVTRLSSVIGHRDEASVALALEHAGIRGVSPQAWIYQQFTYAAIGLVGGIAIGSLRGVRAAVMMGFACCVFGAIRKRNELERRTAARRLRMQAELVDVCNVLAVYARAAPNLQTVVATVCQRGQGEVVDELRRVLHAIEGGTPPEVAFTRAAETTPEPAAAGLYRALSLSLALGGDLAESLLAQAANLRDRQRDARKERAAKRTQMTVGSNTLMVLPMLVLIGAGIPSLVLGSL